MRFFWGGETLEDDATRMKLPWSNTYLFAPTLITRARNFGSFSTGTLVAIAQVVIRVDTCLLVGRENERIVVWLIYDLVQIARH